MQLRTMSDACGRQLAFPFPPQRLVSLCPSQTETLVALGVGKRLVGRTKFCIHPKGALGHAKVVGGTKKLRMDVLAALKPDLVIAEKEEQTPELIRELEQAEIPTYVTNVESVTDAIAGIQILADVIGEPQAGAYLAGAAAIAFDAIYPSHQNVRIAYAIWRDPWMWVGGKTYISDVVTRLGFNNILPDALGRYPALPLEELNGLGPDVVLLSSEPYPFQEAHIAEVRRKLALTSVMLVDGEMFSWYGVRMMEAAPYLKTIQRKVLESTK